MSEKSQESVPALDIENKEKSNEILSKHDMENYQWEFLIDTLQLRDSMFE